MSKTVQDFIEEARQDENLRSELRKIGNDLQDIVDFAGQKGYTFSKDDFVAAVREAGYKVEDKLSDEDLAQVSAGGDNPTYSEACTSWTNCDC